MLRRGEIVGGAEGRFVLVQVIPQLSKRGAEIARRRSGRGLQQCEEDKDERLHDITCCRPATRPANAR
jgi:hypothetical protein